MKPAIKCILTETYTLKTHQEVGYDEEMDTQVTGLSGCKSVWRGG